MGAKRTAIFAARAIGFCGAIPLGACSGEAPSSVGRDTAEIIAGVPANGARLNAIGSIGGLYRDPVSEEEFFSFYCSAALIGPQTVLTAKHCLSSFEVDFQAGFKTVFAVGPNSFAPERLYEVVDVQPAPGGMGHGLAGYGHDIATMHLLEPVADIAPLPFASLEAEDLGRRFVAIGYGVQNNAAHSGTRRAGAVTLRALSGRLYEIIFGNFEAFERWSETGDSPAASALPPGVTLPSRRALPTVAAQAGEGGGGNTGVGGGAGSNEAGAAPSGGKGGESDADAWLREIYESTVLEPGYEALVGGLRGDAQPCFGDSGGPLLRVNSNGSPVVRGVASAVLASNRLLCDLGTVYTTFGPNLLGFLNTERDWIDPCDGESYAGTCEGAVARRCTNPLEGSRRLVELDCSLLGQACAVQADGTAGCSDPADESLSSQ